MKLQGFILKQSFGSVSSFSVSVILGIMLLNATIFSKDTYASEFKLSEGTLKQYRESSKRVASVVADSKIEGMFQNDLDSSAGEDLRKNLSSYKGANVADAGLDIERANDKGARQRGLGKNSNKIECTEDSCELGSIYSGAAVNNRDIAMEEVGFKKDEEGNIIDNKGYLDRAKKITKEASGKFDFIKGEYRGCEATVTENVAIIKESCDQYYDVVHNSCPIKQVVEIDPRYVYQCSKKREVKEKICEEKVIMDSIGCEYKSDCGYDAGGMVKGSIDGNIFWRANYPNLYLGTIDKVRDSGRCHIIDKNINFIVKNKGAIKEFRVTNIQYSDWIRISVNGVQVHNDTGGSGTFWRERSWHGGYGEFTNLHSGSVVKTCNTRVFYNTNPNVDLVPYLRDGNNTIRIELAFGNSGRLYVELRATQYCCSRWKEPRTEVKCRYID
jgi:hypothetical protein